MVYESLTLCDQHPLNAPKNPLNPSISITIPDYLIALLSFSTDKFYYDNYDTVNHRNNFTAYAACISLD